MGRFLFSGILFLMVFNVNGQYREYSKLEGLYKNGKYDKCIEKAVSETRENQSEVWPYVWEMRCFIAIDVMEDHPLKKNAISKALNLAIRIMKKDKEGLLRNELKTDFEKITDKTINRLMDYPETQYNNGLALFEKLATIDNSLFLEYRKYLFMKGMNDESAFTLLKDIVTTHYSLYKKGIQPIENFQDAYAGLMEEYFEHSHPGNARSVYFKACEVYPNSTVFKDIYLDYIYDSGSYIGYYSDEYTLEHLLGECKTADSIFNEQGIKSIVHEIKGYKAIFYIRDHAPKSKIAVNAIIDYLSVFKPMQYDSADIFFDRLFAENLSRNLKLSNNRIFDYWILTKSEIKRPNQPVEAIKSIHSHFLLARKYEQDADFLMHCRNTYPALKPSILPLNLELEKCILAEISKPEYEDNPDQVSEYARKTGNKTIREKQYQLYVRKLTVLLEKGNYSGFAVNIIKALKQYPDDPQLLALKKEWVIRDYKANYMSSGYGYEQFFTRKPDEANCDAGLINKKGHDMVLQKINYCRRLAGVPDSCILDEELNRKCQQAALMMSANGTLSHSPPKTWKCYSAEGASGAGASNLSLGNAFHNAIMGQMEDGGSGNTACGHRRWILNPSNTVFGHGSSMNSSSLYAFGTSNMKLKRKLYYDENHPVCWPSTDYFPLWLVPGRWSFSLEGANFKNAKVTVTENGKPLEVHIEPLSNGYGLNTIVWVISGRVEPGKVYVVTVSDVVPYTSMETAEEERFKTKTFTYRVMPVDIRE